MSKRYADDGGEGDQAYLKRQKISFGSNEQTPSNPTEEIRSARKLRQILAFDQDVTQSKKGRFLWLSIHQSMPLILE